jgi:Family of unknown function (DUF6114)
MPAHARRRHGAGDVAGAVRRAGRGWRRSRPFWGAVVILVAGGVVAAVRFTLPLRAAWTILPAGLLIAGGMIACGLLLLFDPAQRSLYAVGAILLSITALETSHLGGYLVGTLLGLAGGATAFAWVPGLPPAPPAAAPGFTLILGEADRGGGGAARRHRQPGRRPGGYPGGPPAGYPLRPPGAHPGRPAGIQPVIQDDRQRDRQRDRD